MKLHSCIGSVSVFGMLFFLEYKSYCFKTELSANNNNNGTEGGQSHEYFKKLISFPYTKVMLIMNEEEKVERLRNGSH